MKKLAIGAALILSACSPVNNEYQTQELNIAGKEYIQYTFQPKPTEYNAPATILVDATVDERIRNAITRYQQKNPTTFRELLLAADYPAEFPETAGVITPQEAELLEKRIKEALK